MDRSIMSDEKLNLKQKKFLQFYLLGDNATESAKKAGYSGTRPTLGQIGHELLKKPEISAAIKENQEAIKKKYDLTEEKVLKGLMDIAFVNPLDLVELKGGRYIFKKQIAKEILAGANFTIYQDYQTKEDKKKGILGAKLTVHSGDKKGALELLGQHIGMWGNKLVPDGSLDKPDSETGLQRIQRIVRERAERLGKKGTDNSEGGT